MAALIIWKLREASIDALVSQGEPAIPILIEKLKSDDVEIRSSFAAALGSIDSSIATEALISAFICSPDRSAVMDALGGWGSPKAFDALISY